MKHLLILILLVCIPISGRCADTGWAMLAAMHKKFPQKVVTELAHTSPRPYMSVIWKTFGKNKKPLKRLIVESGSKPHTLHFYHHNSTCRRWGGCASYEFMPKLSVSKFNKAASKKKSKVRRRFKKQAAEILAFCTKYGSPSTRCLISPGLEDNFNEKAARNLIADLKEVGWKKEQIVRNPCCGAWTGRGGAKYIEYHGLHISNERETVYSLDGNNPLFCKVEGKSAISGNKLSDQDVRAWATNCQARADYCASWCPQHQGLVGNSTSVGHPRSRRLSVSVRSLRRFRQLSN